jgi:hypothetical protein
MTRGPSEHRATKMPADLPLPPLFRLDSSGAVAAFSVRHVCGPGGAGSRGEHIRKGLTRVDREDNARIVRE